MARYKKGQSGNPNGRPAGSVGYRTLLQDAFVNVMNSPTQTATGQEPYYVAFLEKMKDVALRDPNSTAFKFMTERLLSADVLDQIDRQLNKAKREDMDFLSYRVWKLCHDVQQKILLSKEKYIFCMAGRRAGKSDGNKFKALDVAISTPDARILIIGLSFTRCMDIYWNPILDTLSLLGIEVKSKSKIEGVITLQNNSEIHLVGNTTVDERDKLRGSKWHLVIIDEVQSQKGLPVLIEEIIEPTLLDFKGQLVLTGTGPKIRGSYWELLWCDEKKKALRLNWNISSNLFIPDYAKVLEEIKKEKNYTDKSPLYLREYLGQIAYDDDALVYRITPANYLNFDEMRVWIEKQPRTDIHFTSGLDYGFTDADGFCIVMFSSNPEYPELWIVWEYKGRRTGITELVDQIKLGLDWIKTDKLFADIPEKDFYIYADQGGGGKKISYELATQYQLPTVDAYKVDKGLAIEQLQEEVRVGNLKIKEQGIFADESLKTVFARNDKDELTRKIDSDTYHPDFLDCVLYALRFVWINYKNCQ